MNMTLKVLSAIALIAVTIAAGVIIYKNINPSKPVSTTVAQPSAEPQYKPQNTVIEAVETPPMSNSAKPKYAPNIEIPIEKTLQPAYVPINQASYLQNLRMEGKEYHSSIIGKVTGQASKKDWGVKGTAYFTYLYGVKSVGKILKNDGTTIIEERKFGEVIEDVIVSRYEVGFEIPPIIEKAFSFLTATAGAAAEIYGGGTGAAGADAGYNTGKGIVKGLNQVKIPFTDSMFAYLRAQEMLPPELDPEKVKKEMMMFSKLKDGKILEGKSVRITFKDGQGVTGVTPIDCQLSEQEHDVIIRTNFVLDHYIFPDRKVSPGDEWAVDGDVFAGFLDPRLHGKVGGNVTVSRISDFNDTKNRIAKRLKLLNGKIVFTDNSKAGQSVTGQLSGIKGSCVLPDDFGVITSASMSGFMEYKNVSTDHLLFDAAITVTPRFNVEYQCEVK